MIVLTHVLSLSLFVGTLLGGIINDTLKTRWRKSSRYKEEEESLETAK